jgi:hypothetical protein
MPVQYAVLRSSTLPYVSAATDASYSGVFDSEGVFFLGAQLNEADMKTLRAGGRLGNRTVTISISGLTIDGVSVIAPVIITVNISDFTDTAGRVFFGDRPLNDPGYTAFKLSGAVSISQPPLTAAQKLDVYRVEQRLAYLGCSAFGDGVSPVPTTNAQKQTPHEFKVDGSFTNKEASALKLFESVVNYGIGHRSFGGAAGDIKRDGVAQANNADGTTAWLNAYNAPHWMNVYESLRQTQGYITVTDGQTANKENYGTSWARDLWRGYTYATPSMQNNTIRFNGMTSATLYGTSSASSYGGPHSTHDVGMAIDLGFKEPGFLSDNQTKFTTDPLDPRIAQAVLNNSGHWSKGDAAILLGNNTDLTSGTLPRSEGNNQRAALMSFLSLYDITQRDTKDANGVTIDTGSWDALQIQNGGNLSLDIRTALFGNGSQSSGMISQVLVGGGKINRDGSLTTYNQQNPQRSMRAALRRLGITNQPTKGHQNHFHIYLRPPEIMPIGGYAQPKLLQTVQVVSPSDNLAPLPENSLTSGEIEMFMSLFVPAIPPMQEVVAIPPAIVQMVTNTTKPDMILNGGCNVVQTPDTPSTDDRNGFFPAQNVSWYFSNIKNIQVDASKATVKVIKNPQHGVLTQVSLEEAKKLVDAPLSGPLYRYQPNSGYLGADDAILLVELNGKSYKIHTKFYVVKEVNDNNFYGQGTPATLCANSQPKRVATLTFNQDISLAQWGDIVQEMAASVEGMKYNQYIATASGVTLDFADLPGGAVGETTGTSITLDTNAAGYGWYVDPNPSSNADFLPTANPDVWMAKAGSAAAGKMDMLSVLLHEYGHALGLDHSANPNDFMAPNLQPGERRLPSSAELAQLSQLSNSLSSVPSPLPSDPALPVGTALSALFIGRLRRTDYGSWTPVIDSIQIPAPQFERAVTLCNLSVRLKKMEPQGNNGIE